MWTLGKPISKFHSISIVKGFPGSSAGKESTCNAGDPSSIPGSGRSPGEVFLPAESPLTKEPGGPQSMGSQRVGHAKSNQAHKHSIVKALRGHKS